MPHEHSHSHCHDDSCCSHESECHKNTCHSQGESNHHHEECDFAWQLLELADKAWMEVLKEKIKDHIRNHGGHLDELAKLIAETNGARWKHKMAGQKGCKEYQEKLCKFFSQACEK